MLVVPHLDSAFNLARWILKNDQDAEEVVQDAALRALDSIRSACIPGAKPWFLNIVRNASLDFLGRTNSKLTFKLEAEEVIADPRLANPEEQLVRPWQGKDVEAALNALPIPFLEIVVLRDLEKMSYKEIAEVTDLPVETVASRLSRARQRLQFSLAASEMVGGK